MYKYGENRFQSTIQADGPPVLLGASRADAPRIDLKFPSSYTPQLRQRRRVELLRVIKMAMNILNRVSAQLEAASAVRDDSRSLDLKIMASRFKSYFGHDPFRPVDWANNRSSGAIVAQRLRSVSKELGGGRRLTFICECPGGSQSNAITNQAFEPNVIRLCENFWGPLSGHGVSSLMVFQSGVIIHEMMHILYNSFFHHPGHESGDPERRRDNAHCYEAFVLRAAGYRPDQNDVHLCHSRLAADLSDGGGIGQPVMFRPENIMEKNLIEEEIKRGSDLRKIADKVFWLRHPELNKCLLPASCDHLRKLHLEWRALHETVRVKINLSKILPDRISL